ncbi:MAG: UPF0147 family protein [Caldisphaera sp.]|jgi:uncharacterized protein (UPF0147 family)|uniref:UPF0147 family protein n=1 Tax=Caldisphaera sp. TaxID=2060322 RepID=UPI00397B5C79
MSIQASTEEKLKMAISILTGIVNDTAVPRNIRRAAANALTYLRDPKLSAGVKAANAISALDEISQDPNMPFHARTRIWQVLSMLETIRD